jgi:AraC family transcriptional regulator
LPLRRSPRTWRSSPVARPRDFGRPLRALDIPGFQLRDAAYDPAQEIPRETHPWASLCLAIQGGYVEDWGRIRVRCGPASLVFHPPHEVYGDRISDAGSRCFTVAIAPSVFMTAAEAVPALTRLQALRRGAPSWLAFQLRAELELGDDLSLPSVESAVLAVLADLGDRPALEAGGAPPRWLERVRERIHDEFARALTLAALAETGGVHRVHLARAFRRHYKCTVGDYIRQRRVEYACHRLTGHDDDRLSVIAFDAGFADQSHLTNTFRRLVGMTPGAFRTRLQSLSRTSAPR